MRLFQFILFCIGLNAISAQVTTAALAPPPVNANQPLALRVYYRTNQSPSVNVASFNETQSPICQVSLNSKNMNCTIELPEAVVYHSDFDIVFSWLPRNCSMMVFQPGFYVASESSVFQAPWSQSASDCSGASGPAPSGCFGGVAPWVVPNFPAVKNMVFISDQSTSASPQAQDIFVPSGYSRHYGSNRLIVNDMPQAKVNRNYTPAQLGGAGDSYIAQTFVNHSLTCADDYLAATLKINLFITTGKAPSQQFLSWKDLP